MKKERKSYLAPQVEVIEIQTECCVMAVSSQLPHVDNGGTGLPSVSKTNRGYNASTSSDIEDMINDILTIEQW